MHKQQFSGKSLDDALTQAARAFGADRSALSYNILPNSTGGLFSKLFSRGVKVEVWLENTQDLQAAARDAVMQAMQGQQAAVQQVSARPPQQTVPQTAYPHKVAAHQPLPPVKVQTLKENSPAHPQPEGSLEQNARREFKPRPTSLLNQQQALKNKPVQPERALKGPRNDNSLTPRAFPKPERAAPPKGQYKPPAQPPRERPKPAAAKRSATQTGEQTSKENTQAVVPKTYLPLDNPQVKVLFDDYTRRFFTGFETEKYEVTLVSGDEICVKVDDEHIENLLTRTDKLAGAFEHIFKRIAQKQIGDVSGRILLEAGDAEEQRKERLVGIAIALADKVKKTGKTVTLSSKSSHERRVIHLSLDGIEGVATRSIGSGEKRKLIIYSTEKKQQQPRRKNAREDAPAEQQLDAGEQTQGATDTSTDGLAKSGQAKKRYRGRKKPQSTSYPAKDLSTLTPEPSSSSTEEV